MSLRANWHFWRISAYSYTGGLVLALLVIPLAFLGLGKRLAQRALTLARLALSVWTIVTISPSTY